MRDLPRQLSADELAELFEGRTRFVERLAGSPIRSSARARSSTSCRDDEKREILDAHPAIGQRTGLSARSAAEQGADADPAVLAELERLNADYEARHGFRFVVFVNRRPKAEILEVLRARIDKPTDRRARDRARRARRDRARTAGGADEPRFRSRRRR